MMQPEPSCSRRHKNSGQVWREVSRSQIGAVRVTRVSDGVQRVLWTHYWDDLEAWEVAQAADAGRANTGGRL